MPPPIKPPEQIPVVAPVVTMTAAQRAEAASIWKARCMLYKGESAARRMTEWCAGKAKGADREREARVLGISKSPSTSKPRSTT